MKRVEPTHTVFVGKESKKNQFVEAVKFGFGFYIGFNLGRMLKRVIIATNVSK